MKAKFQRAFTVFELLISMTILGILMTLAFGAFSLSTKLFQDTTTRQSAEMQLRTIKILAERDLELTNFWHLAHLARSTADGERDAFAVTSLSDWIPAGNYEAATGRPAWDRYVVWYTTREQPGRLVRQLLAPPLAAGAFFDVPYPDLVNSNLSDVNPSDNQFAIYTRILSEDVENFQLTPRLQNGTLKLNIRLRAVGNQRQMTNTRTEENLDASITFTPKNTWPAI